MTARLIAAALAILLAALAGPARAQQGTPGLTGIYHGEHRITMRGCPGACSAATALVLGTGVKDAAWTFNFDQGWAEIAGTTLTVGFVYEVQDLGNLDPSGNRVYFSDLGDGTYRLRHGFQIYNPNVGNPRADTFTLLRITRSGNALAIETLDGDAPPDGIPGTQIVNVFPMTVQPDFAGWARLEGSDSSGGGISDADKLRLHLNPTVLDTDGDGLADTDELGPDLNAPLDSDGDGVIDALEPGAAAHDARLAAGVPLLDGVPGYAKTADALAGATVALQLADAAQRFTAVRTGTLVLEADGSAIPDVSLGDAGLDYRHGYVEFAVAGSGAVSVRLTYSAALPQRLLVYGLRQVAADRQRYTLLDAGAWKRVDEHTLEVTVADGGANDLDEREGYVRAGVAPVENTLGGHDVESGNGGGALDGAPLALLALAALALRRRKAKEGGR